MAGAHCAAPQLDCKREVRWLAKNLLFARGRRRVCVVGLAFSESYLEGFYVQTAVRFSAPLILNMTTSTELLIATHNQGKVREFAALLSDMPVCLRGLAEFERVVEVAETGATFAENAALKARSYAAQTGLWTLADDSGLEVDALGGAPGIFSARYGGADASDADRIARLLSELAQTNDHARRARFVCAIAIVHPATGNLDIFTGTCEGRIAQQPRGANGFGYDPLFIPEGYAETFGELTHATKDLLSHRARALHAARAFLEEHLVKSA